ncbi:MAG: nicotinate (nicotinamide) nucleotide adenylyltransferase [Oscillospiraceae bacterium]
MAEVKTGIFGGAFNPPHNGHVNLALEAVKQLNLRRLIIIPTFESPHKTTKLAPFEQRMEMCERAFPEVLEYGKGMKCEIEISDIERHMGGVSYTINTVRELKKQKPDRRFFLLIGGDMLYSFDKWFKYESLLKECQVCAAARGGDNYADMLEFANEMGRIKVLPMDIVDVSSTQVRESVAEGGDISAFVPKTVADYIAENGLYKS